MKDLAHVAFEVDDLAVALRDEDVVIEPREVEPGVTAAFIDVLSAPVKLLEIDRSVAGKSATNPVTAGGKRLRYHHAGIPSSKTWEDEIKVPDLKLAYLPGQYNTYGIEWLRYEEGNVSPDIVKYIPHVAFEVDDIDQAIIGEKVIYHSGRTDPGIIVAMIEVDGASIEFLELDRSIVGESIRPLTADPLSECNAIALNLLNYCGAPGRTRTCDPKLRRLVLCPAELRARCLGNGIPAVAGMTAG